MWGWLQDNARTSSLLCVRFDIMRGFLLMHCSCLQDATRILGSATVCILPIFVLSLCRCAWHAMHVQQGCGVRLGTASLWECSSSAVAPRRLQESEGPCAADVKKWLVKPGWQEQYFTFQAICKSVTHDMRTRAHQSSGTAATSPRSTTHTMFTTAATTAFTTWH